jgi:hypothetical protein
MNEVERYGDETIAVLNDETVLPKQATSNEEATCNPPS